MSNTNKPKPHPHAELIKAWADGAKIQHFDTSAMQWKDCELPNWFIQSQYRIKPEKPSARWKPKVGEEYTYFSDDGFLEWTLWNDTQTDVGRYGIYNCFRTEEEAEAAAERVKAALKGETAEKSSVVELDGKPLTEGEKSLIRALRDATIRKVFPKDETVLCFVKCKKPPCETLSARHSITSTRKSHGFFAENLTTTLIHGRTSPDTRHSSLISLRSMRCRMKLSKLTFEWLIYHAKHSERAGHTELKIMEEIETALEDDTLEIEGYEREEWIKFDPNDPKTFPPKETSILLAEEVSTLRGTEYPEWEFDRRYSNESLAEMLVNESERYKPTIYRRPLPKPPHETEVGK